MFIHDFAQIPNDFKSLAQLTKISCKILIRARILAILKYFYHIGTFR